MCGRYFCIPNNIYIYIYSESQIINLVKGMDSKHITQGSCVPVRRSIISYKVYVYPIYIYILYYGSYGMLVFFSLAVF